jgi:hypothetical protein
MAYFEYLREVLFLLIKIKSTIIDERYLKGSYNENHISCMSIS